MLNTFSKTEKKLITQLGILQRELAMVEAKLGTKVTK